MDDARIEQYFELIQTQLLKLRTEMRAGFENDIYKLDTRVDRLQMSVNSLSDDMRQRLRALNERVAGVENRLAA